MKLSRKEAASIADTANTAKVEVNKLLLSARQLYPQLFSFPLVNLAFVAQFCTRTRPKDAFHNEKLSKQVKTFLSIG